MALPENQLENFIKTILDIQRSEKTVLYSQKDLKDIASEMGFSEDDWQEYLKRIENHLIKGKSFLEHNNPEDAAVELQQAVSLNPYSLEAYSLLAESYKRMYFKTRRPDDRERALDAANKCLKIDSNYSPAYQLITELKKSQPIVKPKAKNLIWVAVVIVFLVAILLFFLLPQNSKYEAYNESPKHTPELSNETSSSSETDKFEDPYIPVHYVESDKSKGIILIEDESLLSEYPNSFSYKLQGFLQLDGIEAEEIKMKVEALNQDNDVLFVGVIEPVRASDAGYRSGDLIPLSFLHYKEGAKTPAVKSIRLSVQTAKTMSAPSSYEESPLLDFDWAYERPRNYDIEIRERFKSVNRYGQSGDTFCRLSFEVKNTGNQSIQLIQLELEWYDVNDKLIDSKTIYVTTTSTPKIHREQVRIASGTWSIPAAPQQIKAYKISVLDIR